MVIILNRAIYYCAASPACRQAGWQFTLSEAEVDSCTCITLLNFN